MSVQVIPNLGAFGAAGKGLAQGLNKWAERKLRQAEYEEQVATQQQLMELAHRQRLQEMAYQQQLETQKQIITLSQKPAYSDPLFILLILFIGIGALALTERK